MPFGLLIHVGEALFTYFPVGRDSDPLLNDVIQKLSRWVQLASHRLEPGHLRRACLSLSLWVAGSFAKTHLGVGSVVFQGQKGRIDSRDRSTLENTPQSSVPCPEEESVFRNRCGQRCMTRLKAGRLELTGSSASFHKAFG